MPSAPVDGRRVAWREAGRGAPALLIHCALAHSGAWTGVMERLKDGLALRAMDLPGHGGTDHAPGIGFQAQATANALALLAASGPSHLVGHSFGATVALRLAVEAPGLVRSLVLVEPMMFAFLADAGEAAAYAEERAASAPFATALAAGDRQRAAEAFLARWGATGGLAPQQAAYILDRMPLVGESERDLHTGSERSLHLDALRSITVPVLLVEGADSPPVVAKILDAVATRLPQARRLAIPGARHMLPVTHPDTLAAAIRAELGLATSAAAAG
jgi:lipase